MNKIITLGIIALMMLSCLVLAMPKVSATVYYYVTVTTDSNVSVATSVSGTPIFYYNYIQQVESGSDVQFIILPNGGYGINQVLADGSVVSLTAGSYTFSNVISNHTLNVSSTQYVYVNFNTYVIGGNGTIHWFDTYNQYVINGHELGFFTVIAGHTISFNAIPDEGYIFSNYTVVAEDMYVVLSTNPLVFVATGNFNITAQFVYAPVVFTYTISPDYQAIYKYSNIEYYSNGVVYQFGNWTLLQNVVYVFTGNIYFTDNGYVRAGDGRYNVTFTPVSSDYNIIQYGIYSTTGDILFINSLGGIYNHQAIFDNLQFIKGTIIVGVAGSWGLGVVPQSTIMYQGIKVYWQLTNGTYGISSYRVTYGLGTNITAVPTPNYGGVNDIGGYNVSFTFNILMVIFFFLVFILPLGYKFGNTGMFIGLIFSLIICTMLNLIPSWCIYLVGLGLILIVWQTVGSRFGVAIPQIPHKDNGES